MSENPAKDAQALLAAQAATEGLVVGRVYRHYKGGLYTIVALSLDEGTLEALVTYRSNTHGTCWTRTLTNFTGHVTLFPTRGFTPRFRPEED